MVNVVVVVVVTGLVTIAVALIVVLLLLDVDVVVFVVTVVLLEVEVFVLVCEVVIRLENIGVLVIYSDCVSVLYTTSAVLSSKYVLGTVVVVVKRSRMFSDHFIVLSLSPDCNVVPEPIVEDCILSVA